VPLFNGRLSVGDQKRLAFIFGVLAIVFVLASLVFTFLLKMHEEPRVWALVEFFLRTVIALCAGGIASCLPGFFDLDWGERVGIRAGGAVGVFALVFLVNPPSLMADAAESRNVISTYDFCKEGIKFDKDIGEDVISICEGMQASFPDHYLTELVQAKLALVRGDERATYHITRSTMLLSMAAASDDFDAQELQEAAKSISHTLRNVTYTFPAPAWSLQINEAIRQQVGLPPDIASHIPEGSMAVS
jgi:hypothetical protein